MNIQHLTMDKIWLAPLAGYTDAAFRILCKRHGADVLVSEMVSADGLVRDSRKTEELIHFGEEERPYAIQIFGSDPLIMAQAAEYCLRFNPDLIDINMGCPVKKVVKRGAGSALMTDPPRAAAIVKEVKTALGGRVPLSVKFRSGWDANSLNFMDFGKLMQDSGADILCLHPRTAKQMFSGTSNWQHITQLADQVSIPLVGNGDIASPEDAMRMYQECGCQCVMIGRGALGKPWLFSQIKEYQTTGRYSPVTQNKLHQTMLEHIDLALEHKPEWVVVKEMRSQLCHYIKGIVGGSRLRHRINQCRDAQELIAVVAEVGILTMTDS